MATSCSSTLVAYGPQRWVECITEGQNENNLVGLGRCLQCTQLLTCGGISAIRTIDLTNNMIKGMDGFEQNAVVCLYMVCDDWLGAALSWKLLLD
eukprot:5041770-Amphidinium_carterae.1